MKHNELLFTNFGPFINISENYFGNAVRLDRHISQQVFHYSRDVNNSQTKKWLATTSFKTAENWNFVIICLALSNKVINFESSWEDRLKIFKTQ